MYQHIRGRNRENSVCSFPGALGHYKFPMLQHAHKNGHHFLKNNVTVLAHEQDWVKRGINKALYIKALSPSINIDPGRHSLSSHFDSILKELIRAPPPQPHNADRENLMNMAPRRQGRPRKQPVTNALPPQQNSATKPLQPPQRPQLPQCRSP